MDYNDLIAWVVRHYRGLKGPIHHQQQVVEQAKGDNSLKGRLVEKSDFVLLAYVAAQRELPRNGPTSLQKQLRELDGQPNDIQTAFATQLNKELSAMEHDVGPPIEDQSSRTPKRRRVDDIQPASEISNTNASSTEHPSPGTATLIEPPNTRPLNREQPNPDQILLVGENEVFMGVPPKRAKELFQDDFWDSVSIYWDEHHQTKMANVSMTTRKIGDAAYYKMEIGILAERVPMWAQVCLGVAVEDKDGNRRIRIPRVGKMLPQPACTIQGGQRDFSLIFKDKMLEAVQAHLIYQDEGNELRNRTEIIEMTIWNRVEQGAILGISLGSWRALMLQKELFAK